MSSVCCMATRTQSSGKRADNWQLFAFIARLANGVLLSTGPAAAAAACCTLRLGLFFLVLFSIENSEVRFQSPIFKRSLFFYPLNHLVKSPFFLFVCVVRFCVTFFFGYIPVHDSKKFCYNTAHAHSPRLTHTHAQKKKGTKKETHPSSFYSTSASST